MLFKKTAVGMDGATCRSASAGPRVQRETARDAPSAKHRTLQHVYAVMMRSATLLITLTLVAAAPRTAAAFCGFYVAGGDQKMFNDATQVVLMRMGTRT